MQSDISRVKPANPTPLSAVETVRLDTALLQPEAAGEDSFGNHLERVRTRRDAPRPDGGPDAAANPTTRRADDDRRAAPGGSPPGSPDSDDVASRETATDRAAADAADDEDCGAEGTQTEADGRGEAETAPHDTNTRESEQAEGEAEAGLATSGEASIVLPDNVAAEAPGSSSQNSNGSTLRAARAEQAEGDGQSSGPGEQPGSGQPGLQGLTAEPLPGNAKRSDAEPGTETAENTALQPEPIAGAGPNTEQTIQTNGENAEDADGTAKDDPDREGQADGSRRQVAEASQQPGSEGTAEPSMVPRPTPGPKTEPGPGRHEQESSGEASWVETAEETFKPSSGQSSDAQLTEQSRADAGQAVQTRAMLPSRDASPAGQIDRVQFVQRVARAFQAMGDRGGQLRLRLHPPDLGSLRLEISVREGAMTARVEAETAAARNLLLDHLPALRDRLAQQDMKLQQFSVDLADRSPGGLPDRTADHADSDRGGDGGPAPQPDAEPNPDRERASGRGRPIRLRGQAQLDVFI